MAAVSPLQADYSTACANFVSRKVVSMLANLAPKREDEWFKWGGS
jgi:hypothetical protein